MCDDPVVAVAGKSSRQEPGEGQATGVPCPFLGSRIHIHQHAASGSRIPCTYPLQAAESRSRTQIQIQDQLYRPHMGSHTPRSRIQDPLYRPHLISPLLGPGLRTQDPGLRIQDSGSRTQDPGTAVLTSSTLRLCEPGKMLLTSNSMVAPAERDIHPVRRACGSR